MNHTPTIRLAKLSDISAIRDCAKLAYEHYVKRMQQIPAPMIADFNSQVEQGLVSIAEVDGEFAGYVVCYPTGDCLHLENVAVLPSLTGRGIGKFLISHAEQTARALELTRVELYTNEKMHENLAIYPRLGYIETERKSQAGFNRVFYVKNIPVKNV